MSWVSIEDKLPDEYNWVLVARKGYGTGEPSAYSIASLRDKDFYFINDECGDHGVWAYGDFTSCYFNPTHWMQLPDVPNEMD